MKYGICKKQKKLLSVLLSVVILLGMIPTYAFAKSNSELSTNISEKSFVVGSYTEFTFTTKANDDIGTMVVGSSSFNDKDAVESLQYLEVNDGKWHEFDGNFGPSTGFPLSDAVSTFRVKFKKAGQYSFTAYMKDASSGETLCQKEVGFSVSEQTKSTITTDIEEKTFKVGTFTEFSFTTVANDDKGTMVIGTSDFSNPQAIEALEYYEVKDNKWHSFSGDFGGSSGFPLSDAQSLFRVKFKTAGQYSFNASIMTVDKKTTLCSVNVPFTVSDIVKSVITTDIGEKSFIVGEPTEFSFTTKANDHSNILVIGSSDFSNADAIEKLEYYEIKDRSWHEFSGNFGGSTGFPMSDATSKFRVTFKKAGDYSFSASMKYADGDNKGKTLCSTDTIQFHVKAKYKVNLPEKLIGGTAVIDKEGTSFIENTEIKLTVQSDKSHIISSIKLNGTAVTVNNNTKYEDTITLTSDVNVEVDFVQIYTVKVYYDGEKGTVGTNPLCDAGSVSVTTGSRVSFTATPNATYRISKITLNDETIVACRDNTYNCNNPYETTFTADKNYDIEVTFAPLVYNVTVNSPSNGNLSVSQSPVDYGKSSVITVTPNDGYCVDTAKVNGANVYQSLVQADNSDTQLNLTISDITEDKNIEITFRKTVKATTDDFSWNDEEAVRFDEENQTYIFADFEENAVIFTTEKEGMRLTYDNGIVEGSFDTQQIEISEDRTITKIELRYELAWHSVDIGEKGITVLQDTVKPVISALPAEANANGYYNSDVDITVSAQDIESFSGLSKVEYSVECDGENTLTDTVIYEYKEDEDIISSLPENTTITINANENNGDRVVVKFKATDRAGNESEVFEVYLSICVDAPLVNIKFDDTQSSEATDNWYNFDREATITIIDKASVFDSTEASNAVKFTPGTQNQYELSDFISEEENIYTATIIFNSEGTYNWSFVYKNKADNEAQITTSGSNIYSFKIDKTAPAGVLEIGSEGWNKGFSFNKLLNILTFGLYSGNEITACLKSSSDNLSGFKSVSYYLSTSDNILKETELEKLYSEGEFTFDGSVDEEKAFSVYARLVDNAGNIKYLGTEGVIYDITLSTISLTCLNEPNENSVYGFDTVKKYTQNSKAYNGIKFNIDITDNNKENEFFSGIKTVEYQVVKEGIETQSGTLFNFSNKHPKKSELVSELHKEVIVNADKNNGKNIVLKVVVTDNAGNVSSKETTIKEINLDKITANISLSGNAQTLENDYGWYNTSRTATITINDRESCFDEENAAKSIIINAEDNNGKTLNIADLVTFGEWNNDTDGHTIEVEFSANAKYTWSIDYKNLAGNTLEQADISYGETESPKSFTVDTDNPTGKLTIHEIEWTNKLVSALTFGLFGKSNISVMAEGSDETSPVKIVYYTSSLDSALSLEALQGLYSTGDFSKDVPVISGEQDVTVYIRVTDKAGNYIYVSSDGYVLDETQTDLSVEAIDEANENGYYGIQEICEYTVDEKTINGIKVAISAKEAENATSSYSGIKSIKYEVKSTVDNSETTTQSGILYSFEYNRAGGENSNGGTLTVNEVKSWTSTALEPTEYRENVHPTKQELCREWAGCIIVDAQKNNSCNTVVYVTVEDNSGNVQTKKLPLDIDTVNPTVDVQFNSVSVYNNNYYNAKRVATVTFTERAHHFDENIANSNIHITAVDINGNGMSDAFSVNWSRDLSSNNPDENKYIATVSFNKDAHYTFDIYDKNNKNYSFVDKAGNSAQKISHEFTIDTVKPTGTVTVNESSFTEFLNRITFGLYNNKKAKISITSEDITSPVSIEYAISNGEEESIDDLEFMPYTTEINIESDKQFDVYARLMDSANNSVIINSNGFIVDTKPSAIELTVDEATNDNGIYGINNLGSYNEISGIKVNAQVNETVFEDVYSGINEVKYEVTADINGKEVTTQKGVLYKNTNKNPQKEELLDEFTGSLIVDAEKNNSSLVKVKVTVTDNAGNETTESINLDIDITKPTVQIEFSNNTAKNGKYFSNDRTAKIIIEERANHFSSENAANGIVITAKDYDGKDVPNAYEVIGWTDTVNGSNPDKVTHSTLIQFKEDANYTFEYSYTDNAGNTNDKISFKEGTVAPNDFTVDKTAPENASVEVNDRIWQKILSVITFGLYSKKSADVIVTAKDSVSPITIEYFKTNEVVALSKSALDKKKFVPYEQFTVDQDEQFVVYVKVTDYAGNYSYISTDGYIVDTKSASIKLSASESLEENSKLPLYNNDIQISVSVSDEEPYSGISKIEYYVLCDTKETQRQTLYSFDYTRQSGANTNEGKLIITDTATGKEVTTEYSGNVPTKAQLKEKWEGKFTVDAKKNNSSNVVVYVVATDNAGNKSTEKLKVDIDVTAPVITLKYHEKANSNADKGYFTKRSATVTIKERSSHFDASKAINGITVSAVNANGDMVENPYTLSAWTTTKGANPDEDIHSAEITFAEDGNYSFDIEYTDDAHNKNKAIDTEGVIAPYSFTVDSTAPYGTITAKSLNSDDSSREETWNGLVKNLVFGFWSNKSISISGSSADDTSKIKSVEYYMPVSENSNENTEALTKSDLNAETSWKKFSSFEISKNAQFTVYIKITDKAGNYTYISTNGLLVDKQHPLDESVAPEISVNPEKPINGIYSDDVKVKIEVIDPEVKGAYSGLKEVSYAVFDRDSKTPDTPTQSGTLFTFDKVNPKQYELEQSYTGSIKVNATKNNSNNIQIIVYATDNSGNYVDNAQTGSQSYTVIKIDTTNPLINVSYDNNDVDSGRYFKADRTATIKITERNFDKKDVSVSITNDEGKVPSISSWKTTKGTYNNDDTIHIATIKYSAEGNYKFKISYTDKAGLDAGKIDYGVSVSPKSFTIDKTIPVVSVSYDNNKAVNNNYYDAVRTASLVINEHNFSTDRISVTVSAINNGEAIAAPYTNTWVTDGDIHSSSITFANDALYTFDIAYTDLAGNNASDYPVDTFFVDTTDPEIVITGVKDKSANGDVVKPVVTSVDTNIKDVDISLSGAKRGNTKPVGKSTMSATSSTFAFSDFEREKEYDDIYTLNAVVTDMAGRTTKKKISFSVNRFGSTYSLDNDTKSFNGKYIQNEKKVVVNEVNANKLSNIKITLFKNNETISLKEGTDYSINQTGGNGEWWSYQYNINDTNFKDEGVYKLTVYSEDEAGNISENTLDTKDMDIDFGIDKTLPTVNVKNVESNKTYPAESLNMLFSVDDNLKLSSVTLTKDREAPYTWEGEKLENLIYSGNDFEYIIDGDSTEAHTITIKTVDAAGNVYEESLTNVYVTTNMWVRYINNKPLLYGTIGGAVLLIALITFSVVYKRRKEEKKKAEDEE